MKSLIAFAVIIVAVAVNGCSQQSPEPLSDTRTSPATTVVATINKNCPVMGSPVTDDGGRYDWNGKNVGFCCPECIDAFAEMSDEEKATAIADADADDAAADNPDHQSHDHRDDRGEPEAS